MPSLKRAEKLKTKNKEDQEGKLLGKPFTIDDLGNVMKYVDKSKQLDDGHEDIPEGWKLQIELGEVQTPIILPGGWMDMKEEMIDRETIPEGWRIKP